MMYLTPQQVADLVGVSKARVHQRITGDPPLTSGALLEAEVIRTGFQLRYRVPLTAALAWRAERASAGQSVGALDTPELVNAAREWHDAQLRTTREAAPVGLPNFRPF